MQIPTFKRALHILFIVLRVVVLVYIGLSAYLAIFQRSYLYFPTAQAYDACPYYTEAERITYGDTRFYHKKKHADTIVVVFHGNGGSACDREYYQAFLRQTDASFLFVEYAGYAGDPETATMERILLNVRDTASVLQQRGYKNILIIGESLGTGPASYLATLLPEENTAGIILVSTYTDVASVAAHHYPYLPVRYLLIDNFTPIKWLSQSRGPVAIIHGSNDKTLPIEVSKQLARSISPDRLSYYEIENAGHNDLFGQDEAVEALVGAATGFLDSKRIAQ